MRTAAALAALLGGIGSVGAFVLDQAGRVGAADVLAWVCLALLTVAAFGAGAGLVSRSATWLRCIVAVCFTLLVWTVLEVLSQGLDERLLGAVVGAVAALIGAAMLQLRPPRDREASGHRSGGSHTR